MRNLQKAILIATMVSFFSILSYIVNAQSGTHTIHKSVASGADDVEEASSGKIYTNSTDLELVYDNSTTGNQTVGIRFTNLNIPANATVTSAYVQFTTDEATRKGCSLLIEGQANANAPAFTSNNYDVSSRSRTNAKVSWSPSPWKTRHEAGPAQTTPELKEVIQEIVSRPDWASGNAIVLLITGKGQRIAYSFERSASGAPKLVLDYTINEQLDEVTEEPITEEPATETSVVTENPFPVLKNSIWKFHDKGEDLGTSWTAMDYDDSGWDSGPGPLGYSNPHNTTLSFGPNSSSKYLTYYMRHSFNVSDASAYDTLVFNIMRDDGAVVYLNGVEQFRTNMPTGTISYSSTAVATVSYGDETTYFTYKVPSSQLKSGANTLAVSVHQDQAGSSDLGFDMEVTGISGTSGSTETSVEEEPVAQDGQLTNSDKIGSFTSIKEGAQQEILIYPEATHTFQVLAKSGVSRYTSGATGTMPVGNDFTAYVGKSGSSKDGFLSVNHENSPGGVSLLNIALDEQNMLWNVAGIHKTDFSAVVKTDRNCSGGITPWGTVITSEETFATGDANGDGYQDIGWNVEIDPATGKVRDYNGDGKPDKLWAMGRMQHENVAVGQDGITVYQGEDGGTSCIYKFVANVKGNLSEGSLYVLKRNSSNPSLGDWIKVPNTTQSDRNNTRNIASSLGGTNWSNVEDVEFGPDGKIYFTSKVSGTIWRFKDNGSSVAEIEAWVTNQNYSIEHSTGTQTVNFGTGIDNLVFDGEGNLWALQDGGGFHIWVIRPDHTPVNPKVALFATVPMGAEGTGLTFSPDFRYGFLSIQHPSGSNSQKQLDAAGVEVVHNAPTTIVFARKEYLGKSAVEQTLNGARKNAEQDNLNFIENKENGHQKIQVQVYPNPFRKSTKIQISINEDTPVIVELMSLTGIKISTLHSGYLQKGMHEVELQLEKDLPQGVYILRTSSEGQTVNKRILYLGK